MKTRTILSIELLEEATAEAGSNLEFRQLKCGVMETSTWMVQSSHCLLQYLESSIPVEAEGAYPDDYSALIVPTAGMMLTQNGVIAREGEWMLQRAGAECYATNALHLGGVLIVYISRSRLEQERIALAPKTQLPGASVLKLYPGVDRQAEFRRLAERWRWTQDSLVADSAGAAIVTLVLDVVIDNLPTLESDITRSDQRAAFDRAREIINARIDRPLSIPELSGHTGVSHRTLRRVFAKELALSPSQYVQARRLEAIRRDLIDPAFADKGIAEIASRYGITHMSRFSATFRHQYGLLPRDARRPRR
jgi:AraC-like DNA-binding protein